MWHSSPSPKYSCASSGHWLASASSMRPGRRIQLGADLLQDGVRLGQVLVVGAFALDQIGHGVEPQAVDAGIEPEAHHDAPREHRGLSKFRSGWCE
jgi:hypothetical protein